MNAAQRNTAVLELLAAGELHAARELAAINVQIMQDEINAFDQATDELNRMLDMAAINRYPLPKKLTIGGGLYHAVIQLLQKYTPTLKDRGLYEAVVAELLEHTQASAVIN
jgi:hypothetical protein